MLKLSPFYIRPLHSLCPGPQKVGSGDHQKSAKRNLLKTMISGTFWFDPSQRTTTRLFLDFHVSCGVFFLGRLLLNFFTNLATYGQILLYCEGGFWGLGADRAAGFLFVKFLKACSGCTTRPQSAPFGTPRRKALVAPWFAHFPL